jgi:hypothetical protein
VDEPDEPPTRPRRRPLVIIALAVGAVAVLFFGITAFTGLAGPGMLTRYPYGELGDLAAAIEQRAGDIRTPDDCWRELEGATGPIREIARVDYLRSRVVVRAYAADSGRIEPVTFRAITDRIDEVIALDPDFSWQMVQIEASPDGWSPLVSCRLVTRGWLVGF